MLLELDGQIDLEHRAYHLSGTYDSVAIAASSDGYISLIDFQARCVELHRPTESLNSVSLHPSKKTFAYVDGKSGNLIVIGLPDRQLACIEPPSIASDSSEWIKRSFTDCHFEANGKFLWTVAPLGDECCEISLYDTETWSLIHSESVEDEIGDSSFSFHETYQEGILSFWMAAGQDGQELYWIKRRRQNFTVKRTGRFANCIPPAISVDGSQFLVITNEYRLKRCSFPSTNRFRSAIVSPNENDPFAESVCYIGPRHAIVSTHHGRIFMIDTESMVILDEAIVPGHEPRPTNHYYPTLKNDVDIATDIQWFKRLADIVVFTFRRDGGVGLGGWKDSLLWYSVKQSIPKSTP